MEESNYESGFGGIERRLEKPKKCLRNMGPLTEKEIEGFLSDANQRAIAMRNLDAAAQCGVITPCRLWSMLYSAYIGKHAMGLDL